MFGSANSGNIGYAVQTDGVGVDGGGPPGTLITSVNYFGTVAFVEGLRDLLDNTDAVSR